MLVEIMKVGFWGVLRLRALGNYRGGGGIEKIGQRLGFAIW